MMARSASALVANVTTASPLGFPSAFVWSWTHSAVTCQSQKNTHTTTSVRTQREQNSVSFCCVKKHDCIKERKKKKKKKKLYINFLVKTRTFNFTLKLLPTRTFNFALKLLPEFMLISLTMEGAKPQRGKKSTKTKRKRWWGGGGEIFREMAYHKPGSKFRFVLILPN